MGADNAKLPAVLPCPFCGGSAHLKEKPEDWGYTPATFCVSCDDDRCRGFKVPNGGDDTKKASAIRKWNRRAR